MIYHITQREDWLKALERGIYEPAGFKTDGFIHCSTKEQVLDTARRYYADAEDLVLLCIDPALSGVELVYENLEGGEMLFPHLYGLLNVGAVLAAPVFERDSEGHYQFPDPLA